MALPFSVALDLVSRASGMESAETRECMSLLLEGGLGDEEGGALLRAWSDRGETGIELAAAVRFLRERAVSIPIDQPCFDLCGTGGSGLTRYNVSTTVAFVAAAAGVPVAKHGNRGSRAPNGSFDLLEALEVPFTLSPENEALLLRETGVCFVFARTHHPAVGKAVGARKAAGGRTVFNLAGPLANPAPISRQIIGAVNEKTANVVAEALLELETEGALVVFGEPGIDEISVTGQTGYVQVSREGVARGVLTGPPHPHLDYSALPGGNADENARLFFSLLEGRETGPLLSMVCENAGAALDLWRGAPPQLGGPGAREARRLIESGAVLETFLKHRKRAQDLSAMQI